MIWCFVEMLLNSVDNAEGTFLLNTFLSYLIKTEGEICDTSFFCEERNTDFILNRADEKCSPNSLST